MFVHTYMLSVDQEDLDRAENTGENVPEYWTPFSFHIDNIEDYYEHLEEGLPKGTTINFISGKILTVSIDYRKLSDLVDKHYSSSRMLFNAN